MELANALPHPLDAYAGCLGLDLNQPLPRNSLALILHFEPHSIILPRTRMLAALLPE